MRLPTYCAFLITALCLGWAAVPTPASAQTSPLRDPSAQAGNVRDLKCDNAVNPRGVTTQHPQFSWTWVPANTPRAYQILVASSEEKLDADEADLWDSGQVRTDKKTAEYQGKPLLSLQRYYWKIRVWSDYDTPTVYTEPATWQMALLTYTEPEGK